MRRVVWAAVTAALVAQCVTDPRNSKSYQPSKGLTWEQVVQGAAANPKTEHPPWLYSVNHQSHKEDIPETESDLTAENSYNDAQLKNDDYVYADDTDYEYNDAQFKNDDYVYVDDIEEVENPEDFQFKDENANRRVLDFLYHTFAQPVIEPNRAAQPSLIGEVWSTIDNHFRKDFTSLANLIQGSATVSPASAQQQNQAFGTPIATGIAAGPTGDDLLVTDDLGNQHLVSVDDIVRSLSVLDESSLVDLLLGPAGSTDPALSIQLPPGSQISSAPDLPATQTASAPLNSFQLPAPAPAPLPVPLATTTASPLATAGVPLPINQNQPNVQENIVDTSEIVILPGQLTKAIRNVAESQGGEVFRPARHTGPANSAAAEDDESFLVTDEHGNVQIISMNDILSSLSNLDEETLTSLLVDTSAASQIASNSTHPVQNLISIPNFASEAEADLSTGSLLQGTDFQEITPVSSSSAESSHLGASALPDAQSIETDSPLTNNKKTVVSTDGTEVSTDEKGNIYISPDPAKPFTLDIGKIIALAEQAEQSQTKEDKASEFSGALVNQLPSTKTPKPTPERGNEILAYLAGDDGILPEQFLPGPISQGKRQQTAQPQENDLRTALLNSLLFQQTTPAPAPPGIGAQFSGLLSRIVNQAAQVVGAQPVTPAPTQQDEVVQLVVREQFEDGGEEIYGNINVPLPQSIHHSQLSLQKLQQQQENRNSAVSNVAQRREDTVPEWTSVLPRHVVEYIARQRNDKPTFDPANAVQREASPLERGNYITQHIIDASESHKDPVLLQPTAEERESHYAVHHEPEPTYGAPKPTYAEPHPVYSHKPVTYHEPHKKEEKHPLFDIFLLFDHNKAAKLGHTSNLSKGAPLIGDPSYFVDTRTHHKHHY